jgi:hypothetical protein
MAASARKRPPGSVGATAEHAGEVRCLHIEQATVMPVVTFTIASKPQPRCPTGAGEGPRGGHRRCLKLVAAAVVWLML